VLWDDITAGVEYLIKQGIVDPKRICIYGANAAGAENGVRK
jgi:dipeptidyl aminopeptidase/acylaminoacyl peptidase